MNQEAYYPTLTDAGLSAILIAFDQLEADPLWLDRDQCPYPVELREKLRAFWMRGRTAKKVETTPIDPDANIWDVMTQEAQNIFKELRDMRETLPDDVNAKVAYFRAAGTTMEKVVQLGERAANIKNVSEFQSRVMDVFEQVLTPEQRTRAMEMMGK